MGTKVKMQKFDNWIQDRMAYHKPVDMFGENIGVLVEEEGSIFPFQKDEAIRVEELYKCSDLNDDVLGLNVSNQRMHYNFGEFLTLDYIPAKTDGDVPDSNPRLSDDVEIFCDGILEAAGAIFPQKKSILSDSYEDCLIDDKSVDEATVAASTNPCSNIRTTLSDNVFNFKKKPRIQRVRRMWNANRLFFKEDKFRKPVSSDIEDDNVHLPIKRSRKRILRYAEEFAGHDLFPKEKIGNSSIERSKKQHYNKGFEANRFTYPKETFNGESIQVPFGEPILSEPTKKKVHQPTDWKKCNGVITSSIDTEVDSVSVQSQESQEYVPEDDCDKEKTNNARRKHHKYWSITEVINLVEGVSMYGVGKWTEIKRLRFNSSPNRTSVDLKDKWRNLLRASNCSQSKRKREAGNRKKHTSQQIPQSILRRVKELAVIYPYPRPPQALQASYRTYPKKNNSENGICLPIASAVKV